MGELPLQDPFGCIREFEWDERKRAHNFRKHGIDFNDVRSIFDGPIVASRSDRGSEVRYLIFGYVDEQEFAVACTFREARCRIISARRARSDEREKYYRGLQGRSETR